MHFITSTALLYYRLLYVFITSVCFIKTVGKARNRSHHLRLGNSDYSSHRKWKMTSVSFIRQLYCRNQHPSMSVTIATNYIRGEGGTQHENSFLQINRQCLPNAVHRSSRAAAAPTRREQRTDELLWTSTTQQTHQLTFFNRLLPNDLNPISTKNNSYISDKSEIIGHSSCSFPFPATHHTHATTKNKKKPNPLWHHEKYDALENLCRCCQINFLFPEIQQSRLVSLHRGPHQNQAAILHHLSLSLTAPRSTRQYYQQR